MTDNTQKDNRGDFFSNSTYEEPDIPTPANEEDTRHDNGYQAIEIAREPCIGFYVWYGRHKNIFYTYNMIVGGGSTSPHYLSFYFQTGILTLKGKNLLQVAGAINTGKVSHIYKLLETDEPPDEGQPIITDIIIQMGKPDMPQPDTDEAENIYYMNEQ